VPENCLLILHFYRNLRQTHSFDNQSETGSNRGRRPLSHHETTDDDSSDYSLTDDESLDGTIKPKVSHIKLLITT
jgi:deferrochelatase/peroxidase EfeB